ncbi:phosphatidate cytidylyltransferase [Flavobacterium antarcticum]|uniref:phosphatidate cytidylyltransferase n=1 Tax=Flavobacterium antarcticum TaxID=271155 RepID=UPI0003B73C0B|nr:phosphatidate cytidylyltransferase [Flavobacterium antarcticum]
MNETLKRAISGAIYILLLIFSITYSTESFFVLFGIFLLIAVYEFCELVHLNKIIPIISAFLIYGSVTYLESQHIPLSKSFDYTLLIATLVISFYCMYFLFDDKQYKVEKVWKYLFLLGYVILPFIIITKIPFGVKGYNHKIIIGIFILIWTNDTFAYIVGKSIGKHKLYEKISPKKTIEGFIGGIVFAMIASYFIAKYYIEGKEVAQYIWLGFAVIVGVFGTIGDLIESKFKRIANVKDSGAIMPGHGGILDRLDSVIFVAPFIFLFYQLLPFIKF